MPNIEGRSRRGGMRVLSAAGWGEKPKGGDRIGSIGGWRTAVGVAPNVAETSARGNAA